MILLLIMEELVHIFIENYAFNLLLHFMNLFN
jgi:hypothetical protein